jgi:hypothetical protein
MIGPNPTSLARQLSPIEAPPAYISFALTTGGGRLGRLRERGPRAHTNAVSIMEVAVPPKVFGIEPLMNPAITACSWSKRA